MQTNYNYAIPPMYAPLNIPITADCTSIAGTFCVIDHHQHGRSLNTVLTIGWENLALVLGLVKRNSNELGTSWYRLYTTQFGSFCLELVQLRETQNTNSEKCMHVSQNEI